MENVKEDAPDATSKNWGTRTVVVAIILATFFSDVSHEMCMAVLPMYLRSAAWVGRGFRSPLRDFMLADAVEPKYFGLAH
jgi:hypothetical protein